MIMFQLQQRSVKVLTEKQRYSNVFCYFKTSRIYFIYHTGKVFIFIYCIKKQFCSQTKKLSQREYLILENSIQYAIMLRKNPQSFHVSIKAKFS
jgi:hypothetical protein